MDVLEWSIPNSQGETRGRSGSVFSLVELIISHPQAPASALGGPQGPSRKRILEATSRHSWSRDGVCGKSRADCSSPGWPRIRGFSCSARRRRPPIRRGLPSRVVRWQAGSAGGDTRHRASVNSMAGKGREGRLAVASRNVLGLSPRRRQFPLQAHSPNRPTRRKALRSMVSRLRNRSWHWREFPEAAQATREASS